MQGAGEGRELSITFQTSGKAVRLGAPEKWRKAIAGEDLKPDTWVEIHRQGGSPQTLRADDVPELHRIFLDQGVVQAAPPVGETAIEEPQGEPATIAANADAAEAASASPTPATVKTWRSTDPPQEPRDTRGNWWKIGLQIIVGLVMLTTVLRTCGRVFHHSDASSAAPGQVRIAVDSSAAPSAPSSVPPPADAPPETGAGAPAAGQGGDAATREAAAGPSFDCGRVNSEILKLICATPDLAAADRSLAAAYSQALAASADPAALRESERAWLAERNAGPADVDQLRAAYAERIQALRDQLAPKSAEPF